MITYNKKLEIIGVCSDKGASTAGCDKGPEALRLAGLVGSLTDLGYDVYDLGDICLETPTPAQKKALAGGGAANPKLKNLAGVAQINNRLGQKTYDCLRDGGFPLVLGGDHSVTAGPAYAALKYFGKIGIIWADAHGDFNNAESSPSGNIHGMPLSALCGLGPREILPDIAGGDGACPFIDPKNAVIIGARDLDDGEKNRLKKSGVTVITPEEIDKIGMPAAIDKAIKTASSGTNGIYFSFDLDCLDPAVAAGMGTPAEGGLTFREARLLCEQVYACGKLIAADMVELNPLLDEKNRAAFVAAQLIRFMLGKTLY